MKNHTFTIEESSVITQPNHSAFDEHQVIIELKHYLPAQAPLKDFIHHNKLHGFQGLNFHKALRQASQLFGYKVSLSLDEYRSLYHSGKNTSLMRKIL